MPLMSSGTGDGFDPKRYMALVNDGYTIKFVDGPSLAYVQSLEARLAALEGGGGTEPEPQSLWAGHQPGRQYVGSTRPTPGTDPSFPADSYTSPIGVQREYYQWNDDAEEDSAILDIHSRDCLPWVSFKPGSGGWNATTRGDHDGAIRAKARRYAGYSKPVLTTFHHEPVGDGPPGEWVSAFLHVLDVMEDEVGSLNNTTFCPIYNEYIFHPWYDPATNPRGHYTDWLTDEIVARCPLIGVDAYAKAPKMNIAVDKMRALGVQSAGMAEFGRAPIGGPNVWTLEQFGAILDVFTSNADFYSVVSYFDGFDSKWGDTEFGSSGYPDPFNAFDAYLSTSCHLSGAGF